MHHLLGLREHLAGSVCLIVGHCVSRQGGCARTFVPKRELLQERQQPAQPSVAAVEREARIARVWNVSSDLGRF